MSEIDRFADDGNTNEPRGGPDVSVVALIEALADPEHAGWSDWMAYLFSRCHESFRNDNPARELIIPAELVARWERQIGTPYAELSEAEKESDRNEARERFLPVIRDFVAAWLAWYAAEISFTGWIDAPVEQIVADWRREMTP